MENFMDYGKIVEYEVARRQEITATVLAILSLVAWIVPVIGIPVSIAGFVLALKSYSVFKSGTSVVAIIFSVLGLIGSLLNSILGAIYYGSKGVFVFYYIIQ